MRVGTHVLGELYGCSPDALKEVSAIRCLMRQVVDASGFHVVGEQFHQFNPHGVTGVLVLSESHFSIHTWPELGLVAADIFTCGEQQNAVDAFQKLCDLLRPSKVTKRVITR
ncbi:MAG TPA: adenosylmethionine decarboxylase [Planctomycetaceae bacterium]|nr:adenosylmethionine decarboxylase [Planctomycetaceae bacterium]HIQ21066.1 adenosylmethionine decarboxylase [Planctomycetota bacterium]